MGNDKPLSNIMEFDEKPNTMDLGISNTVAKKVKTKKRIAFLNCPICGLSRKLNKNGRFYLNNLKKAKIDTKKIEKRLEAGLEIKSPRSEKYNPHKETRFDTFNMENEPFVSLRTSNGRGTGFEEVAIIKMSDINGLSKKDRDMMIELINELRGQCSKILEYTKQFIIK